MSTSWETAKRKIDMAAIQSSFDSDADVNAVRRQTLAALYQVEHPHLF